MMVLSEAPLNFIAMAPPAHRLCDDMRSRVYPRARRQSAVAPHRTATVMFLSDMVEVVPGLRNTVLRGVARGRSRRLLIRQARATTGQIGPPIAKWWTNAPFVPFLVLAMEMAALSARRSALREASG
jgi:hypothetical protein